MTVNIVVDELPEKPSECPFSELIHWTSKYACKFRSGMYSRCHLDCGGECPFLTKGELSDDQLRKTF